MARPRMILLPFETDHPCTDTLKVGTQRMPLSAVKLRRSDTRRLNPSHVVVLAQSIQFLGLLEPIIVSQDGTLLAGAHRLAAMRLLAIKDSSDRAEALRAHLRLVHVDEKEKKKEPLTKMPDDGMSAMELVERRRGLDGDNSYRGLLDQTRLLNPDQSPEPRDGRIGVHVVAISQAALSNRPWTIETAENAIRRQYTLGEVHDLAERLNEAGFTHKPGKPKAGEKTLVNAMRAILGKSDSQVRRLLDATPPPSPLERATSGLLRSARGLLRIPSTNGKGMSQDDQLMADLRRIADQVVKAFEQSAERGAKMAAELPSKPMRKRPKIKSLRSKLMYPGGLT